nr:MAG TPA: hypothetical protein [Bacteriophage sp.]
MRQSLALVGERLLLFFVSVIIISYYIYFVNIYFTK